MSALFSPMSIGTLALENRIVVAPMCQYSADDGVASDWHLIHLGQLAISGAGLVIVEATAVSPDGRITPGDLGLYSDRCEEALGRVLASVRRYADTPLAIQLAHAGRKASSELPWDGGAQIPSGRGGWTALAPSAIAHADGEEPPAALDDANIARIIDAFAEAARRAARIGAEAIEVHAAHGYLLHEFLSPLSNRRSDRYGGSLDARCRFPLEVFAAVRSAFPAGRPVGVRISATDWVDGGWDLEQSVRFCRELEAIGCAYIHVSSGGLSPAQRITPAPGFQVPLAARIRESVGIPVVAVGMISDPEHAEAIVASGQADLVALARGILYDPRWPWHAAARLGARVSAPAQYWRCLPAGCDGLFGAVRSGGR